MSKYCFGIYWQNDSETKLITNFSQFNYLIRFRIRELIDVTVKEMDDRIETCTCTLVNFDMSLNSGIYLVGIVINQTVVYLFTTEPEPHNHLLILAEHLTRIKPFDTIAENFDLISTNSKINEIKLELDQTRFVMIDNVHKLLKRGEQLEDLMDKTKYLDQSSKEFYRKSRKWCCVIL